MSDQEMNASATGTSPAPEGQRRLEQVVDDEGLSKPPRVVHQGDQGRDRHDRRGLRGGRRSICQLRAGGRSHWRDGRQRSQPGRRGELLVDVLADARQLWRRGGGLDLLGGLCGLPGFRDPPWPSDLERASLGRPGGSRRVVLDNQDVVIADRHTPHPLGLLRRAETPTASSGRPAWGRASMAAPRSEGGSLWTPG